MEIGEDVERMWSMERMRGVERMWSMEQMKRT